MRRCAQGCVFTRDVDAAIAISDAMETGTVQVNGAPARGAPAAPPRMPQPRAPRPDCSVVARCKQGRRRQAPAGACRRMQQPRRSCRADGAGALCANLAQRATLQPTSEVSAGGAGPDHFPFQGFRDSGMGSQGIKNSLVMMTKDKTTVRPRLPRRPRMHASETGADVPAGRRPAQVINLAKPSYTMG